MSGPVKILRHPAHPMLIVFPLGLLGTAVIFDLIAKFTGNQGLYGVSYWMMAAGVVGGLLAAIFGLVDWMSIRSDTRAKSIGAYHGLGNLAVVILFALSWWMRSNNENRVPDGLEFTLSLMGFVISLVTGWLGGELVYRLGIAVEEGAHENAPNSLTTEHPVPPSQLPGTGRKKQTDGRSGD